MLAAYTGNLFLITRASDKATLGIGTLSSGVVNAAAITAFCVSTTCTIADFYDQAQGINNLVPSCCGPNWPTGATPTAVGWTTPPSGLTVPIARIIPGEAYLYGSHTVPTGNSPITMYMVVENASEGGQVSGCCGSFGDTEDPIGDGPNGAMFSLAYGHCPGDGTVPDCGAECPGNGVCVGIDLENGIFLYPPIPTQQYLSVFGRYSTSTTPLTVKYGDATQGSLTTVYSGNLPTGWTMNLEGTVSLGMGGDGSNSPINFIEGVIIAAATTDATDNTVQANITNFYGPAQ